ncbi:hypothetical protein [Botrimarina colliarenosi]|nr:hypothetical protein [Botrimarina colliarenosi]
MRALACGLLLAALTVGCDDSQEDKTPPPPPPTPEERFAMIVGALEEQLEDSSFGTAEAIADYNSPPGTPITDATVKVEHELTPPEGDDGVYRAQLCIITDATVTITLPTPSQEEKDAAKDQRADANHSNPDIAGMPSIDALKVPSIEGLNGRVGSSSVHEIDPGVTQRCFDLEFRDNRWVLLTELDRENEPFNALAIEYALKKQ